MFAPVSIKKVWILSFEFSGLVKVGGLGEAVSLIARELSKRGFDVTVIMPSHGITLYNFRKIEIECRGSRYGTDGCEYPYNLAILEGFVDDVRILIVKGDSPATSMVLDSWPPYRYAEEKACLLARAVRCIAQKLGYPDIVHANDWHSAIAVALLKIDAELQGYSLPTIYQIHLRGSPSYPWHYASEQWCGLRDEPHRVWAVANHVYEYTRSLWDSCWGNIECFIVKTIDAIVTVSKSELDLLARDYGSWVKGKTCYSYNSTSWSLKDVEESSFKVYGTNKRDEIRWRILREILQHYGGWGNIVFNDAEVLVVSSGRLTPQKGFDTLIQAVKYLPSTVKVVVLGKSVGDKGYEHYLRTLIDEVKGKTFLVINDVDLKTYQLLIYVAHVYTLPSRYEPFGISGIEALALGTPVVVTNVGGLKEYVSDLRYILTGIGLVVQTDNPVELAFALQSLGYLMYYSETGRGLDKILFKELRDIVLREPRFGEKLRKLAISYVDMLFRPQHTVNSILACYELARQMAYYRAHT